MQNTTGTVNFAVRGAKIVLTSDVFCGPGRQHREPSTTPLPILSLPAKNPERDLETGGKPPMQGDPPHTLASSRMPAWIMAPLHLIVVSLLAGLMYTPTRAAASGILLSVPCLWLVPVILDIFTHNSMKGGNVHSFTGFMYIFLFPIWVQQVSSQQTTEAQSMLSIMVTTTALLFFSPVLIARFPWVVSATLLLSTLLLPVPVLFPLQAPCIDILCTCVVSSKLLYVAVSNTYSK